MGLFTKYGTLFGSVPETVGTVFFVAPSAQYTIGGPTGGATYAASDDNDGLSPDRAKLTIAGAISAATANAGDVIALLPGTHSSASQVAINKAGLMFVGLHPSARIVPNVRPYGPVSKVNWTSTLAGTAVALTVADCAFVGINMIPVTARTFMSLATCPRTMFLDCSITMSAAASTSTKGLVAAGGSSSYCSFQNCYFLDSIATSAQGPCMDLTALDNFVVENCTIACTGTSSAWAIAVQLGAGSSGIFRNNHIAALGAGTITIGVDGTGVAVANAVLFSNNFYGVSPGAGAVKNLTNADGGIVQNFYATIGGGAGFVIQTVTA